MSAQMLLDTIKQAALEAGNAGQPLALCYGTVTSESPIKLMVDNKMELDSKFLIVPVHLTDREVEMTLNHSTEEKGGGSDYASYESHSHRITGKKTVLVHEALKAGEKVMLLRMQGGQSYLILCRL